MAQNYIGILNNNQWKHIFIKWGGVKRPSLSKYQRLLFILNNWPIIHKWASKQIIKQMGLPTSTLIKQGFYCSSYLLSVGKNTGLADLFILAYAPVRIGKGCSFSFRNMIITSTHDYNDFGTIIAKPVTIGDNVWVTSNVTILPGVTIGSNTVIGAGSVVTNDIPSGVFAAGNPCRVIRQIEFKKHEQ